MSKSHELEDESEKRYEKLLKLINNVAKEE